MITVTTYGKLVENDNICELHSKSTIKFDLLQDIVSQGRAPLWDGFWLDNDGAEKYVGLKEHVVFSKMTVEDDLSFITYLVDYVDGRFTYQMTDIEPKLNINLNTNLDDINSSEFNKEMTRRVHYFCDEFKRDTELISKYPHQFGELKKIAAKYGIQWDMGLQCDEQH